MKLIVGLILCFPLVACTVAPADPFQTGKEVSTPYGCEQAKKEGRDVKC
jgi:hypothetical protein